MKMGACTSFNGIHKKKKRLTIKTIEPTIVCESRSAKESVKEFPLKEDVDDVKDAVQYLTSDEERIYTMLENIYNNIAHISRDPLSIDKKAVKKAGTRLTYGEIHPIGVNKMMDREHLNVEEAKVLLDIGSGRGKLAIQCFEQFALNRVIGVEISKERYELSCQAAESYVAYVRNLQGRKLKCEMNVQSSVSERNFIIQEPNSEKHSKLEIYSADIGDIKDFIATANPDIVVMDVAFPSPMPESIVDVLLGLRSGARIITYENLSCKWPKEQPFPFREYARGHQYMASWKLNEGGHSFFSYKKRGKAKRKRDPKVIDLKEHFLSEEHFRRADCAFGQETASLLNQSETDDSVVAAKDHKKVKKYTLLQASEA